MTWLSLAANRHEIKAVLQRNIDVGRESRTSVIRSLLGRYALLSGAESQIRREVGYAETILTKYHKELRPPNLFVMSDGLDLAIIASLGSQDYFDIIKAIANAPIYEEKEEATLQLLAKRIIGKEELPTKTYKKHGHIKKPSQWLRVVKEFSPADVFDLAVTLEHPESDLLERFILPLAFLLARSQVGDDWRPYLKELVSWGSPNFDKSRNIVFERTIKEPDVIAKANPQDKSTWRGFDAVEVADDEVFAYYYLGVKWEAPLFFQEEINVYSFLDDVELDWKLVEENVDLKVWDSIKEKTKENKCKYVVVYDSANASAPEPALERARQHYGLKIITLDISEI